MKIPNTPFPRIERHEIVLRFNLEMDDESEARMRDNFTLVEKFHRCVIAALNLERTVEEEGLEFQQRLSRTGCGMPNFDFLVPLVSRLSPENRKKVISTLRNNCVYIPHIVFDVVGDPMVDYVYAPLDDSFTRTTQHHENRPIETRRLPIELNPKQSVGWLVLDYTLNVDYSSPVLFRLEHSHCPQLMRITEDPNSIKITEEPTGTVKVNRMGRSDWDIERTGGEEWDKYFRHCDHYGNDYKMDSPYRKFFITRNEEGGFCGEVVWYQEKMFS